MPTLTPWERFLEGMHEDSAGCVLPIPSAPRKAAWTGSVRRGSARCDDAFTLEFRPGGDLGRGTHVAPLLMPTINPSSFARFRAHSKASSLVTVTTSLTSDLSRFLGMKPAPMPWILCGPGWPPPILADDTGSTAMAWNAGFFVRMIARHAGDGAAGADAGDDGVDVVAAILPDLRPGGALVNRGIGWVVELLRHPGVLVLRRPVRRLWRWRLSCLRRRSQHEIGPHGPQQAARRSIDIDSGMVSVRR